ncbi:MAG: tetratricopeptide repeat protein, partial [Bacteroidota bacterium]
MRISLYLLFYSGLLLFQQPLFSQTISVSELVDSLKKVQTAEDSVDILNKLAWELESNIDRGLPYALRALEISEQRGYEKGLGDSYSRLGMMAEIIGNYELAVFLYQSSLEIRKLISITGNSTAGAHNNLGNAYAYRTDYLNAIHHFRQAIQIRSSLVEQGEVDPYYLAMVFINLSSALAIEGQIQAAIDTLREVDLLELGESEGYLAPKLARSYGLVFLEGDQFDSASHYYRKALKLAKDNGAAKAEIAEILNQMGLVAQQKGLYQEAIDTCFTQALAILGEQDSSSLKRI